MDVCQTTQGFVAPASMNHQPSALPYVAAFALTGMVTTMLGPILPDLLLRWSLSDAAAGALFSAQFSGGMAGGAVSGLLVTSLGDRRALALGYGTMVLGLVVVATGSHAVAVAGALLTGLGVGFVVPSTNLLVARRQPGRAASALGALNLVWGLGAASWPLCVSIVARGAAPRTALFPLAAAAAVTSLGILSRRDNGQTRYESRLGASGGHVATAHVALFGVVIFLYSGIEMALGGWLPEYARRASTVEVTRWAAVGTAFWGGLSAGRGAIAVRLESRHEDTALFAGLLLATAGVLILLRVQSYALLPAVAGMCGFGLGPVFPVTAAAVSRRMPTHVAGPLLSLGSLGGAVVPWFVGLVSDRFRSLASGFTALLALLALLIGLHVMRRAGERASDRTPGPAS